MFTFKQFITEVRIKLGSVDPETTNSINNFMDDYHATTKPHPMNNNARMIGHAETHVSPWQRGIHIHDIVSHVPKSGAGTHALKHLTALADKHKVKLSGTAYAFSKHPDHIQSSHKLGKWYKKHGFNVGDREDDGSHEINYYPHEK